MLIGGPRPARYTCSSGEVSRSYVLFDNVQANVPRWGSAGECGAWNYARGLAVELSRVLAARPISVHYRELERGPGLPVGNEVTAVVQRHPDRQLVTVTSRRESAPYGPRGDNWQLTVNNTVPADGAARHPPALPGLARLVRDHLLDTDQPADVRGGCGRNHPLEGNHNEPRTVIDDLTRKR